MVRSCCCSLHETGADHKYRRGGRKGRVKKGLDLLASKYSPNFLSLSLSISRRSLEALVPVSTSVGFCRCCRLAGKLCKQTAKEKDARKPNCILSIILPCIWQLSALGPSARAKPPCQDIGAEVTGSFPPPGNYREEWHRDRKDPLDVSKRKRRGSEYLSKLPTVCCP